MIRRVAGILWLAIWCGIVGAVASPWRNLGGLESERLRWLLRWALCGGASLGFTLGQGVRVWAQSGAGRTHARALRLVLYPPGIATAAALLALSIVGERGPVGVVATLFLAYWGGFDAAFGAVPLIRGKSYAFSRTLEPDDDEGDEETPEGLP